MKKLLLLLLAPIVAQAQTIDTAVPTVQALVQGCPVTYLAGSRTVDLTPNKSYELEAGCALKQYTYAATGANAELRNADIADAATVDAGTATDKVMSVAETKRIIDAVSHGSWLSDVADITARDAVTDYQSGDKIYVADDGDTNWAVYSARADSPTAPNWYKISDFDDLNQPIATLTQAQVESTTGADYTSVGLATAERLDQWGRSRKLQRVFNVNAAFDFAALNYGDKEAIYVRNNSAVNGIGVTYGAGGANTLLITRADGTVQTIAGQDSFNVQPSEIVVMEQEGADIRASIIPGERISKRENYAAAAAFAAYPHDGIVLIQDTGEIFGRKTDTNAAAFPADGQANADWWKVGGVQTDTKIMQTISVAVRSFGTNASSRATISFVDKDGATYPAADWMVSGTIPQYAGGGGPIVLSNNAWGGSITLGHNKDGNILFSYVGQNANGLSAINYIGTNSADSDGAIVVNYAGTDFSESFAGKAAVTTSDWTALPVFASSTPINPDDITEWSDTESNIPLGALRKVTGTPTAIYGRTVDDATADGGSSPDGTKWQDVTAQVTPALITVDSDTEGPTYFALYDKPQPRRYLVTGSTNITMLFPSDGGANVDSQALVINKGTGSITVDGGVIAQNMSALITADAGVDGPHVQIIGGGSDSASPVLEREVITVAANTFTLTEDRHSQLAAAGVAAGDTVTMPDLTAYVNTTDERRGTIVNSSGIDIAIDANGNTDIGATPITTIMNGFIYQWRQTGPSFYELYEDGRFGDSIATYNGIQFVDSAIPLNDSQTTVPSRFVPEGTPPYLQAQNDIWVEWDTGLDLTNVDYLEAVYGATSNANNATSRISVQVLRDGINNGQTIDIGVFDFIGTTRLRLRVNSIADLNAGVLQFASNTTTAMKLYRLSTWANAANGYVIPSGTVVEVEDNPRIIVQGQPPSVGNISFDVGSFTITDPGDYEWTAKGSGRATQTSRITYTAQIRDAANGAGSVLDSGAMQINLEATNNYSYRLSDAHGEVTLAAGTYYFYVDRNTGGVDSEDIWNMVLRKVSKTVMRPEDAALPTSFSDLGIWNGVNLQTLVTNGMIIGNGTGAAGTGAPHGAFTGSMKVTAIGDWIQQDFLTGNAPGTVVGERFSRQSFNGGTTWSAWFGQ